MTSLSAGLGLGVTLGTSGTTGTTASSGTSSSAGTSGTSGTSSTSASANTSSSGTSTSASANTPTFVAVGTPIATWNIQVGETIYFNRVDPSTVHPTAWVPMVARFVFADGNAVLTRDPNIAVNTGKYTVGTNLRRKTETYNSSYPGP